MKDQPDSELKPMGHTALATNGLLKSKFGGRNIRRNGAVECPQMVHGI